MNKTDSPDPAHGAASATAEHPPEPAPPPAPEPWTPERAREWLAYYDRYVLAGVVVLVAAAAAFKVANSATWPLLAAGRAMIQQGRLLLADPFSYTMYGQRWVNVPWLFAMAQAGLANLATGLTGRFAPEAEPVRVEQIVAGTLVAVNALVRGLTAILLLRVRRPGPGAWWAAVCVLLALGAMPGPTGDPTAESALGKVAVIVGGLAGRAPVLPETWGLLLFAGQLLLMHRAFVGGSRGALYGLVPLFLLWANVDVSFLYGLIVLGLVAVGHLAPVGKARGRGAEPAGRVTGGRGLVVLAASALACLANPSTFHVFPTAASTYFRWLGGGGTLTQDQLSVVGTESAKFFQGLDRTGATLGLLRLYYAATVGVGVLSFVLNWRRFSVGRFLAYVFAAVLWGALLYRANGEFAIVWAATLILNGQEWYQDAFGTKPRTGGLWSFWSVGGRAATIVMTFLLVFKAMTGYGDRYGDPVFGFGADPDAFAFEAADWLRDAPLAGRPLNLTLAQGDALIGRAAGTPGREVYVDSRRGLYGPAILDQLQELKASFARGKPEVWKPILDPYGVGFVMLDGDRVGIPSADDSEGRVYLGLKGSPDWAEFYDDGRTILFGRVDPGANPKDAEFVRGRELEPEALAYRRAEPVRGYNRPPIGVGWTDKVFQNRRLATPPGHLASARRWLARGADPADSTSAATTASPGPTAAQCLLAIREARRALNSKPDDPDSYLLLALCYQRLYDLEAAQLTAAGVDLTETLPNTLRFRQLERLTALNYAIQTTPPPQDDRARQSLRNLHLEVADLDRGLNYIDLARDHLEAAIALSRPDEIEDQGRQILIDLNQAVKRVEGELDNADLEGQSDPIRRAMFAAGQGCMRRAIRELDDAQSSGLSLANIKWRLVDLYCDIGEPDKALELVESIDDPGLATGPGTSAFRQGRIYLLLGNYENASYLWRGAIAQLRNARSQQALFSGVLMLKGELPTATSTLLEIGPRVGEQAEWEYALALCQLEEGMPGEAAGHFRSALTLEPEFAAKAVADGYLEKIGEPAPAAPAAPVTPPATEAPAEPATTPAPAEPARP